MGCWTETCILSKLPIEENEFCVMLLGKDILPDIFDINKLNSIFNPLPYFPDMHIYKGVYQGRGNLEGRDELEEDEEYEYSIFVNNDVWNWLLIIYDDLELARTKQSYKEDLEDAINRFEKLNRDYIWEYMKVCYSVNLLRLVPNSIKLKGYTEVRLEKFKEWLEMLNSLNNNKIKQTKTNE